MSDAKFAAGLLAGLMPTLEAYADSFERLAATPEQQELAEQFRQFVLGLPGLTLAAAQPELRQCLGEVLFGQDPEPDEAGRRARAGDAQHVQATHDSQPANELCPRPRGRGV